MSKLEQRAKDDLALRNAARAVFLADLAQVKHSVSNEGLAERLAMRVGDGTKDVLEHAGEIADDNRGTIAVLIGAIVLWFARGPIAEILGHGAVNESEGVDASEGTNSPAPIEQEPAATSADEPLQGDDDD